MGDATPSLTPFYWREGKIPHRQSDCAHAGVETPCNGTVWALRGADRFKKSRNMCSHRVKAMCRASQHKSKLKATLWMLVAACGSCGLVSYALTVMVLM